MLFVRDWVWRRRGPGRANMFHNKLSHPTSAELCNLCQDKQNTCPTLWQHIITMVRVWHWLWVQNTINFLFFILWQFHCCIVFSPVLLNTCQLLKLILCHGPDLLLNAFIAFIERLCLSFQISFTMTLQDFWRQLLMRKLPFLCVVRFVCWGAGSHCV